MVEFKQIIGRGTRLFDDKYFFTIYDFVGANKNFKDAEWDGDPFCPICGNYPCTCNKHKPCPKCGQYPCVCETPPPEPPKPCPYCGHLPCTCEGGQPKKKIRVKLSEKRELALKTEWTETFYFGDKLITLEDFIKELFGRLPKFFNGPEDLRHQWENPQTRQQLLDQLAREGFVEEKLDMVRRLMGCENCDLYDILSYLAYETTPLERAKRAEIVRQDYMNSLPKPVQQLVEFLMSQYVNNGYKEMAEDHLSTLLKMKYGSPFDATKQLHMQIPQIRDTYFEFQRQLYKASGPVGGGITLNIYENGSNYYDNSRHITLK